MWPERLSVVWVAGAVEGLLGACIFQKIYYTFYVENYMCILVANHSTGLGFPLGRNSVRVRT